VTGGVVTGGVVTGGVGNDGVANGGVCGKGDACTLRAGGCAVADGSMCGATNAELHTRAAKVLVGGVNSPVRAFRSVGGTPYTVARGEGAYVFDVEGNRYIDYVQSYGASILGHADPHVVATIREAAGQGTAFGAPTYRELLLAETIADRVRGVEMVRMTSSGTEATMSAIRLARGVTGRHKVLKFAGCYHGATDSLLAEGGSGVANQGISGSAGVPPSAVADTIVAPYNVVPEIDDSVAVVAVEPVAANMGLVAPVPGFLEGLRAACDRAGALLFFDEVITGFRIGNGGATAWSGVQPDLWAFAKVIGGGLPVGAFGASRALMAHLAPIGPVYQGGTMSGNPLACAAGLAVLEQLDVSVFTELSRKATVLATGLAAAIASAGIPVQTPTVGPLVGLFFSDEPVFNYDAARVANEKKLYAQFFHGMLRRGVALAPGAFETMFPSLSHSDRDVQITIDAAADTARDMAATLK
jgi:glutamate-1-semialdehyde 2,1-aminomutase